MISQGFLGNLVCISSTPQSYVEAYWGTPGKQASSRPLKFPSFFFLVRIFFHAQVLEECPILCMLPRRGYAELVDLATSPLIAHRWGGRILSANTSKFDEVGRP